MKLLRLASGTLASSLLLSVVGCGAHSNDSASEVQWTPIKDTTRAVLEKRDLVDEFLFGFRVVDTKGFFTTALSLDLRPTPVKLELGRENASSPEKLFAVDASGAFGGNAVMAFDVQRLAGGGIEIDFATETFINLTEGLINPLGGQLTEGEPSALGTPASWTTASGKKPRVLKISQDTETLVADVEHFVTYTRKNEDGSTESRNGSVTLRLFLARQSDARGSAKVTVGQARAADVGFFGADMFAPNEASQPIAHYDFGPSGRETKTVYLKDFPSEMVPTATRAITAWNIGFGFEAFRVEVAPSEVDIGDPRYNVVKWFNGLEKEVPWAGYAPTLVDPRSGKVVSTQILINGSSTLADIEKLASYTNEAAKEYEGLKGTIGGVPVVAGAGESPVLTFFTDTKESDPKAFVQGFYFGVIMHEFGHSLGLRHNFAASTQPDPSGIPSSVMDYEPNFVANKRQAPGSYDIAAIRLGYFGEKPRSDLAFCTDEDLGSSYACNQGDLGDPAAFAAASVMNGIALLKNGTVALPSHVEKPMMGSIRSLYSLADKARWSVECEGAPRTLVAEVTEILSRAKEVLEPEMDASRIASFGGVARDNLLKAFASYESARPAGELAKAPSSCAVAAR